MSRINVDKITGATGTASGAPITLSGDTATLSGTGVTFPAGHVIQTTQTTYNSGDSDYISGTTFTRFEASSSYHWTGAITNVLASSHVYITMCFSCVITTSSGDDIGAGFQIWRDTSAVLGGNKDGKTSTSNFISGMYKAVPPLQEMFNMAGMQLPNYLKGEDVENKKESPAASVVQETPNKESEEKQSKEDNNENSVDE